jgi:pyridoxamine 5'-phosphate oxidase
MCAFKSIDVLSQTREEYGSTSLFEADMDPNPIEQFKRWFDEHAQTEPKTYNAMVLSTVDDRNQPDSRVVLLKELADGAFVFYTHYDSAKGLQIAANSSVALNFYWPHSARQVRIRGQAHRVNAAHSDEYFYSRPVESQFSSIASHQSQVIPNQAALIAAYQQVRTKAQNTAITRPESWGGYAVIPTHIEFWQGRDNRLHDRIQYILEETQWCMRRLAP